MSGKTSDTRNSGNTANKTLTGTVRTTDGYGLFGTVSGIFSFTSEKEVSVSGSAIKGNSEFSIDATHSHNVSVLSTDTETRPENYTVRIWKRVS